MSGFSHGATTKPTLTLPSPFDKESLVRAKGAVSTEPWESPPGMQSASKQALKRASIQETNRSCAAGESRFPRWNFLEP